MHAQLFMAFLRGPIKEQHGGNMQRDIYNGTRKQAKERKKKTVK